MIKREKEGCFPWHNSFHKLLTGDPWESILWSNNLQMLGYTHSGRIHRGFNTLKCTLSFQNSFCQHSLLVPAQQKKKKYFLLSSVPWGTVCEMQYIYFLPILIFSPQVPASISVNYKWWPTATILKGVLVGIRASHAHILERTVSFASFPSWFAVYLGYIMLCTPQCRMHWRVRQAGLIPALFCHLLGLVTYCTSQDLMLIIIKAEITVPFSKVTGILKTHF